ncbi:MAG: hypothetical protein ACJ8FS_05745 [Sphingomicrobium sp.]
MSRAVLLSLGEAQVRARCLAANVGVSAVECLVDGGVRLVCMSGNGAELIRKELNAHLIKGEVISERHRPRAPLW